MVFVGRLVDGIEPLFFAGWQALGFFHENEKAGKCDALHHAQHVEHTTHSQLAVEKASREHWLHSKTEHQNEKADAHGTIWLANFWNVNE